MSPDRNLPLLRLSNDEPDRCGMGQEAKCCIFLVVGANGFECARFTALHDTIVDRRPLMHSQRMPEENYPDCQLDRSVTNRVLS